MSEESPLPEESEVSPTRAEVEAIIALAANPVLRNLRITQAYHDLARAIAPVVGEESLNWCAFAIWASKAAGAFVRLSNVKTELARRLAEAPMLVRTAIARIDRKLETLGMRHRSLRDYVFEVLDDVSGQITLGNLIVFTELAPLFVAMIETYGPLAEPDEAALAAFVAPLRPGKPEDEGQDLLRGALTHYFRARFESDPKRKAEHVLAANFQVGLHEQTRLQPPIQAALDAPVDDKVRRLTAEISERLPGGMGDSFFKLFLATVTPLVAGTVKRIFREVSTRHLIRYRLPGGTLNVGRDVPARPGQPPFPPVLAVLADPDLVEQLTPFGVADESLLGSRAGDWADLTDRMGYIAELFRSRQQDLGLFAEPFTAAQRGEIAAGRVPPGDL